MDRRVSSRAELLLRAPRGLAVLSALAANDPPNPDLVLEFEAHRSSPAPTLRFEAEDDKVKGPERSRPVVGEETPNPYLMPERTLRADPSGLIDDVPRLAAVVLDQVGNWAWKPGAQAGWAALLRRRDDLAGVAEELVAAPAARWWWEPMVLDAQVVLRAGSAPPDVGGEIAESSPVLLDERTRPAFRAARLPDGFATATSLGHRLSSVQLCDLDLIYHLTEFSCWRLPVKAEARVFELHAPSDWWWLCERYPVVAAVPPEWRNWSITTASRAVLPDWDAVSADFDGVHLSMAGLLTTAGLPMAMGYHVTLAEGAETEHTFWFRDCFEDPVLVETLDLARAEDRLSGLVESLGERPRPGSTGN